MGGISQTRGSTPTSRDALPLVDGDLMLEMIGAESRAFEHKRLREGLVRLSVFGPGKPEKSEKTRQEVKQEGAKKQDARRKNKKRSGRRRRESRKEKKSCGGSSPQLLGLAAARIARRY